jgi:multidrug efflux pump subunit AcrA (membrane-fusion protein)
VIFEVANPKGRLRIGLFAEVSIKTGIQSPVLAVPESALLEEEGKYSVYYVRRSVARRDVESGRDGGWVEVERPRCE